MPRANCPKCTGRMLADQLRCDYPTCSGGIIMVKNDSLDSLARAVVPEAYKDDNGHCNCEKCTVARDQEGHNDGY